MRSYQEQGLDPPAIVREATQAYRDAMDPLADFLVECCERDASESALFSDLWETYQGWAAKHLLAKDRLSQNKFSKRLDKADLVSDKGRPARRWGVSVLPTALIEYRRASL